jgi:hypothetical protein
MNTAVWIKFAGKVIAYLNPAKIVMIVMADSLNVFTMRAKQASLKNNFLNKSRAHNRNTFF